MDLKVYLRGGFDVAKLDFATFGSAFGGGVKDDVTSYIIWKTFTKTDNINARIDTCSFSTRKYGSKTWTPTVGQEIEVFDGATKIFAGVIVKVSEEMEGARLPRYDVQCKDWTHYLDRKLVVERYTSTPVSNIVSAIISEYTSGFTVVNVDCDTTIDSISFNYVTVSQAIQTLAEQVNYCWYVDYDKDIHFFPKNEKAAPFNLDDTSGNHIYESLVLKDDLSQLRNIVIVRGGEKEGNSRTEKFTGDGIKAIFPLSNKFSSMPTVVGSATPYTVGVDFLNEDTDYDVLWNYNEKYIRFTSTPLSGSPISVEGVPLIPIIVQVQDDTSIGTYGEYEFKKIDKSIKTTEEAKQYAVAQLDAYKTELKEGTFQTYTSGLRSGQLINIDSDIRDIDEDFLIQSVLLKMRGYNQGIWNVTLATLRTVGIIDFLQRLLLDETKKITFGENEILEKYYSDNQTIQITELIEVHEEVEDFQTVNITELIRRDPWTVEFVLGEYFPSSDADPKCNMRLDLSSYLY